MRHDLGQSGTMHWRLGLALNFMTATPAMAQVPRHSSMHRHSWQDTPQHVDVRVDGKEVAGVIQAALTNINRVKLSDLPEVEESINEQIPVICISLLRMWRL